jgi:hypothetical protein
MALICSAACRSVSAMLGLATAAALTWVVMVRVKTLPYWYAFVSFAVMLVYVWLFDRKERRKG